MKDPIALSLTMSLDKVNCQFSLYSYSEISVLRNFEHFKLSYRFSDCNRGLLKLQINKPPVIKSLGTVTMTSSN